MLSCQNEKKADDRFPFPAGEDNGWVVYEGRVPLNEKAFLYQEVSMFPINLTGEGFYELAEYIEENDGYTPVSSFRGKYATFYGREPEERLVEFYNSIHPEGFRRTYPGHSTLKDNRTATHLQMVGEEIFRKTDLTLKIQGKNKLIILDQRLEAVTLEPEYNLAKRTSRLFTIEGYFRHTGDTADFFEMNTKERWRCPRLAAIVRQSDSTTS